MSLASSIQQSIQAQGAICLSGTLHNMVSDFSGYDEVPATKQVLKCFVIDGYGTRTFQIYQSGEPWQVKMQQLQSEFEAKTGFKVDLIRYVFGCVEYGLGWISIEPTYDDASDISQAKDYAEDLSGVDLDKQLVLMQKEYISMLNSLIVVPEGKLYKKSGYYPAKAISELWVVEHKIDIISAALGIDNSAWCTSEKDAVLNKYDVSKSSQLTSVLLKVVLPAIVAIALLGEGITYLSSVGEIKRYNVLISSGDNYLKQGNYADAIEAYSQAADGYKGAFATKSKKNSATLKVTEAITPLFNGTISASSALVAGGHYLAAQDTLRSLEKYPFSEELRSKLVSTQEELQKTIDKAVGDYKYVVLNSIRNNGRTLDTQTLGTIEELLKVAPNDYWLNFVYNKSK